MPDADLTVIMPPANLAACEVIIERGLKSFTEVGMALIAIRDGRLYRASYPTFEAYCDARWGFSRSRAHDLITSTKVTLELSAIADTPLPTNEGQARALNGLEPEQAAEVMTEAHQATNGKPTAAAIEQARLRLVPQPQPARPKLPKPSPVKSEEQQDAEDLSSSIAIAINLMLALDRPTRRQEWVEAWRLGSIGASPPQRENVTPAVMRGISAALLNLADEWTQP